MAIDYNILVKIESVDKVRLHEVIKKIHNINPVEVDILNGVVVYNTVEEIGFSYSLANTKDLLWGWDDVVLKEDFTYEQRIGFRLNKFNYDKAIKNLFSVFRYLFLEIKCDFLIKSDDNILLLRIENTFFSPEENINWVKHSNFRFGNFIARFARKKEERWFVFRAKPEKRTTFPLFLRAKRAEKAKAEIAG